MAYDLSLLSPRQREVYDLRKSGVTAPEVAIQLDISKNAVECSYKSAKRKIRSNWNPEDGKKSRSKLLSEQTPHNRIDVTDPEKAAEAMIALSVSKEARGPISRVAEELGIAPATAYELQKRMDGRYVSLSRPLGETRTSDLRDLTAHNAFHLLAEMARRFEDPQSLKKEKMKDLSISTGIMIQNHQLLDGKPTQILAVEQSRNMGELRTALLAEMKRRDVIQVHNPTTGKIDIVEAEFSEEPGSESPGRPRPSP